MLVPGAIGVASTMTDGLIIPTGKPITSGTVFKDGGQMIEKSTLASVSSPVVDTLYEPDTAFRVTAPAAGNYLVVWHINMYWECVVAATNQAAYGKMQLLRNNSSVICDQLSGYISFITGAGGDSKTSMIGNGGCKLLAMGLNEFINVKMGVFRASSTTPSSLGVGLRGDLAKCFLQLIRMPD